MDLLYYILSVYGICGFIAISGHRYMTKIGRDAKGRFTRKFLTGFKIIECPFCLGFWVGLILFLLNPFTELFTFDITLFNTLLMSFISAGTTYVIGSFINDGGVRIDNT